MFHHQENPVTGSGMNDEQKKHNAILLQFEPRLKKGKCTHATAVMRPVNGACALTKKGIYPAASVKLSMLLPTPAEQHGYRPTYPTRLHMPELFFTRDDQNVPGYGPAKRFNGEWDFARYPRKRVPVFKEAYYDPSHLPGLQEAVGELVHLELKSPVSGAVSVREADGWFDILVDQNKGRFPTVLYRFFADDAKEVFARIDGDVLRCQRATPGAVVAVLCKKCHYGEAELDESQMNKWIDSRPDTVMISGTGKGDGDFRLSSGNVMFAQLFNPSTSLIKEDTFPLMLGHLPFSIDTLVLGGDFDEGLPAAAAMAIVEALGVGAAKPLYLCAHKLPEDYEGVVVGGLVPVSDVFGVLKMSGDIDLPVPLAAVIDKDILAGNVLVKKGDPIGDFVPRHNDYTGLRSGANPVTAACKGYLRDIYAEFLRRHAITQQTIQNKPTTEDWISHWEGEGILLDVRYMTPGMIKATDSWWLDIRERGQIGADGALYLPKFPRVDPMEFKMNVLGYVIDATPRRPAKSIVAKPAVLAFPAKAEVAVPRAA